LIYSTKPREGHANLCPVRVFFTLCIGLTFLGDKYVINGFSHGISFVQKTVNEINQSHPGSAFRF
ncbi:hypothetical protein, partial [Serratia sp. BW106]|uniref:hypothetical protein n=1 Tax=Serratia sp. BW106 TaxID=1884636 RepID=UPI001E4027A0